MLDVLVWCQQIKTKVQCRQAKWSRYDDSNTKNQFSHKGKTMLNSKLKEKPTRNKHEVENNRKLYI